VLRESGQGEIFYSKFIKFWMLFGPISYLINFWWTGASYVPWVEGVWGLGLSLMGLYPLYCLLGTWWRGRKPRHLLYSLSSSLSLVVGVADTVLLVGKSPFGSVGYSLQVVAPLWFGCVALVLISDFVRSLRAHEEQRALMDLRLSQQEHELQRLHAQENAREREKATLDERERIMQDMHDGLGSQLISSLALSQSGQLSAKQTQELLRGCIDDLRLAIDASGGEGHDLVVAVGNLRFRMTPRLRAAGIILVWNTVQLAERLPLSAPDVLGILRIVQEAMTNILKHADAKHVKVLMRSDDSSVFICVEDDGLGIELAANAASRGKGLSGMEKRARSLKAQWRIISPVDLTSGTKRGTRIELTLPFVACD
jgi:signal transduction histidine kinase